MSRRRPRRPLVRRPNPPPARSPGSGPAGPAFFLSYARAYGRTGQTNRAAEVNRPVSQLFQDLSSKLPHMVPLPAGQDLGFMDSNMEAGMQWAPELLRNLATCRVFVALISEPYLVRSKWCAMEWDLFSRRTVTRVRGDAPHATAIVPVTWTPMVEPAPPIVAAVQRFRPIGLPPEIVSMYDTHGLMGMSEVDPGAYKAVVWSLARKIYETWACFDVAPAANPSVNGLRRSFLVSAT